MVVLRLTSFLFLSVFMCYFETDQHAVALKSVSWCRILDVGEILELGYFYGKDDFLKTSTSSVYSQPMDVGVAEINKHMLIP